jgi:hypothetical protein
MNPGEEYRDTGCDDPGKPRPSLYGANPNPAYITDAMWGLWQGLLALEPDTQLGGIYAAKAGYHNTRNNLPAADYSVSDNPPDRGGPGDKAAALDWTFPEAQSGNYTRIAKYTSRLLASAQDHADPRLDGWREFYGQADWDSYVEGWDCRYGYACTSDSSHLWHIHFSENRDQTTSKPNKDALLSVLKGEALEDWEGDVTAKDVWNYDIDPSGASYTAGGAQKTTLDRTDYLANDFAPAVIVYLDHLQEHVDRLDSEMQIDAEQRRAHGRALAMLLVLVIVFGGAAIALQLLD